MRETETEQRLIVILKDTLPVYLVPPAPLLPNHKQLREVHIKNTEWLVVEFSQHTLNDLHRLLMHVAFVHLNCLEGGELIGIGLAMQL